MKFLKTFLLFVFLFSQVFTYARKIHLGIATTWTMSEFDILKANYPFNRLEHNVAHFSQKYAYKTKRDVYYAHCAINLSEAFLQSGYLINNEEKAKCSLQFECETERAGQHFLMASHLAHALIDQFEEDVVELSGENYLDYVKGKKGIIYFENYWSRNAKEWELNAPTGDHIDLWDGNQLVSYQWAGTFIRNHLTNHTFENKGKGPSPLKEASKVYFFEME